MESAAIRPAGAKAPGCLLFVGFLGQARKSTRALPTRSRSKHPSNKARETWLTAYSTPQPHDQVNVGRFRTPGRACQLTHHPVPGVRAPFLACPRKGAKRRAPCVLVLRTREPLWEAPGLTSVERLFGAGSTRHRVAANLEATSLSLRPGRPTLARQDNKGNIPTIRLGRPGHRPDQQNFVPETKKAGTPNGAPAGEFGRSGRIRTYDPYVPNVVLYQAELHSEMTGDTIGVSGRAGH